MIPLATAVTPLPPPLTTSTSHSPRSRRMGPPKVRRDDGPGRGQLHHKRGNFFAVNRHMWGRVCDLGMNPAVAYLVLACGSDAANRFTNWSINAVETHTGISRGRAKTAVETLVRNQVVRRKKKGTLPRYQLAPFGSMACAEQDISRGPGLAPERPGDRGCR